MELKFPKIKKKKRCRNPKVKDNKIVLTEDDIQNHCNDYLDVLRIRYIRIPNPVWDWIKHNAPPQLVKIMSKYFGGMPDNIVLEPIGKYNLALLLELKTEKGKEHGKQKNWYGKQIARSPEEVIKIVTEFEEDAAKLRAVFENL